MSQDDIRVELLKALNSGLISKAEYDEQLATLGTANSETGTSNDEWERLVELPLDAPRGGTLSVMAASRQHRKDGTYAYGLTFETRNISGKKAGTPIKRSFIPEARLAAVAKNLPLILRAIEQDKTARNGSS